MIGATRCERCNAQITERAKFAIRARTPDPEFFCVECAPLEFYERGGLRADGSVDEDALLGILIWPDPKVQYYYHRNYSGVDYQRQRGAVPRTRHEAIRAAASKGGK